jgi:hypothetical protein
MATMQHAVAGFSTERPVDLSDPRNQERLSPSAIQAFFKIVESWELNSEAARQLLGGISNGSFYDYKNARNKSLDQDKLTRVSLLLGIYKALNILYSGKLAASWINLPNSNPMFAGQSPLTYIVKGGVPALVRVRQLLDARRGGR